MQRKIFMLTCTLCASSLLYAQEAEDTTAILPVQLNEFVYSANKFGENKTNIVQPIQTINKKQIEWGMPQTSASMVEQTGNVFVQRSQAGGGSAVIRGFEAGRVQMVVDGVRMNNAVYRTGHLQNIITIDNNMLERVEVIQGPASTLYGSDALGGVILFQTKKPQLAEYRNGEVGANFMSRFSSANKEGTGHVDFNLGFRKWASLSSITYSKFGDMRQGSFRNPFYDSYWLRPQYVTRINGADSIVPNADANVQKYSGYEQVDLMEKILYQASDRVSHTLNLQYSTSSDIPRYDRLTDVRNGALRFAEWYYGPQDRFMTAYQLNAVKLNGFIDEITAGVNYQAIEESRYQRNRGDNRLQNRIENVNVIGYNIDLRKVMGSHELNVGTDGQLNDVASTAYNKDIVTGEQTPLDTRYPDGGSKMYYGAVYAQHIWKIVRNKLVLNDGLRLNYVNLDATFNDKSFYPFPFSTASSQNTAWSGNLGLAYMPGTGWRLSLNGSTGFRAPNVDDLAKVFESAGGVNLVVPNPDLKPEYTYNADFGIAYHVNKTLKIEANGFYTWFRDAIVQDKYTLNGADSVLYDGKMTAVVANQNKAKAYIYGFNAAITARLTPGVTFYSTVNFTYGRYNNAAGVEVPLDHIPPVFGKTSLLYEQKRFTGEVYAMYNGWKRLQDYSPSGEDNLTYATPKGMPAWYTLNLRLGYRFLPQMSVQVALENIMDYNYRMFASGISAPGRNFVLTLRGHL